LPVDGQDWVPPDTVCSGTPRPDYPLDYCSILPVISNTRVNNEDIVDVELTKSQFINLTFNTDVDDQQLPMVMYAIDWGDNEKTVVTGVEMRDRPNIDNPHSLYHLYSYWDLKAKNSVDQTLTGGENSVYCGADGSQAINYDGVGSGYTCSGSACCVLKPKIKVKDNWGWCNDGTSINDCDQWEEFSSWVVVSEK
jgi:hypothetical protein